MQDRPRRGASPAFAAHGPRASSQGHRPSTGPADLRSADSWCGICRARLGGDGDATARPPNQTPSAPSPTLPSRPGAGRTSGLRVKSFTRSSHLFHASLRRRKFSWDSTPHFAQIHAHFWDTATDSRHFGRKSVCATPPSAFRSVLRRTLLAARWVWPPAGTGPDVPDTVRWLPHKDAPDSYSALRWPGLPRGADGALVFAWRVPGASPDPPVQAISLEALDANGVHVVPRWRRTIGSRKGCTFEVNAGGDAGIVVVEGEMDALAACWLYLGHQVCACGGTAGLMSWKPPDGDSREIIVEADADRAGIRAAARVQARLLSRGRTARIAWNAPGMDTASTLEDWLVERAAVR